MNTLSRFFSVTNATYLIVFIFLSSAYLFFSFSYTDQPLSIRITSLIFVILMMAFIYSFFLFIFIGVSQITASIWRNIIPRASQDNDLPETLMLANLLFIFILGIYIDQHVRQNSNPSGELSMVGVFYYMLPFFTSLFGGIFSGTLVLLNQYDSRTIIQTGRIVSITAVLLFFAYHFLTIRS